MQYYTYIRRRKSRGSQEWLARLVFKDEATGERGEMCRSAESRSEAQRKLKSLEHEFLAGGKTVIDAQHMPIGELLEHCLKTRYYEPNALRFLIRSLCKSCQNLEILLIDKWDGRMHSRRNTCSSLKSHSDVRKMIAE